MIYKVSIESNVGQGASVTHSFEIMVENEEQAEEFGTDCGNLFKAWSRGFNEVDFG